MIDLVTWKLKSCPRCGGDMFLDTDLDSWYEQCLQCSYQRELQVIADFKEQPAQMGKEPAPAGGARLKRQSNN